LQKQHYQQIALPWSTSFYQLSQILQPTNPVHQQLDTAIDMGKEVVIPALP